MATAGPVTSEALLAAAAAPAACGKDSADGSFAVFVPSSRPHAAKFPIGDIKFRYFRKGSVFRIFFRLRKTIKLIKKSRMNFDSATLEATTAL